MTYILSDHNGYIFNSNRNEIGTKNILLNDNCIKEEIKKDI